MNTTADPRFASDNTSPAHPLVLKAMEDANAGFHLSYGDDVYTAQMEAGFRALLGEQAHAFAVPHGTGANVFALAALLPRYGAVLATASAHIHCDESGAPENVLGTKIYTVQKLKLEPSDIHAAMEHQDFEHHNPVAAVSITQSTEDGLVYSIDEIRAVCTAAAEYNLPVHVDGARLANACAYLQCSAKAMLTDAGVSVVSFGGTKNGLVYGEAVVFLQKAPGRYIKHLRKQHLQLMSKMRYVSAQLTAYLKDDLWLKNGAHANKMSLLASEMLKDIPGITIINKEIQANALFVSMSDEVYDKISKHYFFYMWSDDGTGTKVYRLMTNFATTEQDIHTLCTLIAEISGGKGEKPT